MPFACTRIVLTPDAATQQLLFDLRRSARYHDSRIAHFGHFHKATNAFTILLAGMVVLDTLGSNAPHWIKCFAAGGAVMGVFDLVVGFSNYANQHRDSKQKKNASRSNAVSQAKR